MSVSCVCICMGQTNDNYVDVPVGTHLATRLVVVADLDTMWNIVIVWFCCELIRRSLAPCACHRALWRRVCTRKHVQCNALYLFQAQKQYSNQRSKPHFKVLRYNNTSLNPRRSLETCVCICMVLTNDNYVDEPVGTHLATRFVRVPPFPGLPRT